jgi:GGDEF domain-containing protein
MRMEFVRRLRDVSLLARFGVTGLLLTVALGLVLADVLSNAITERARQQAEWTVISSVRLGLQSQLAPADLANGFPAERLAAIEKAVHASAGTIHQDGRQLSDLDPVELNIYNMAGTVVYSDDHRRIGTNSRDDSIRRALRGEVVSGFATDTTDHSTSGDRRLLEVYVPLQYQGVDAPEGVVELYLPYAPVAAAVQHDVRTLIIALSVGLAAFFAVMFRVVAGASRRLRRQTQALKASAERDRQQATHDALTGLPNRLLVQDRLERALAVAARKAGQVGVLLIGLDRFKEINDALGHSYGDRLLTQIGPRLRTALRDGDTVARLGGDEFAVLLPTVEGVAEARAVAARHAAAQHSPI